MKEVLYVIHMASITFTDDDLLLGMTEHTKPLYITRVSDDSRIIPILIDPESSINLIPLRILESLSLGTQHLSSKKIVIQGFNQHSQQATSSIVLLVQFGQLYTEVKFHTINADTSYRALLGRLWIHDNYIVPSTLHQCMKYKMDEREFVIKGDI